MLGARLVRTREISLCLLALLCFFCSLMSDYLRPHGLQQARLPCPSPSPRVSSNSCPLSQWCHPTIPSSIGLFPPALNFCQHQDRFQWVGSLHQVAKYWSFSFSISPSSEYSGLISFRTDWFELLAVQGTDNSLLQHHSVKASLLGGQPSLWSNSYIGTWLLEKQ